MRPTLTAILSILVLFTVACGGEVGPSAGDATSVPPSVQSTTTTHTLAPTTSSSMAHVEDSAQDEDVSDGNSGAADTTYTVVMTDFAFDPEAFEVSAGQTVAFEVVNNGAIEHEFRLSNEHRIEEHIAAGHEDHGGDETHHPGGDLILLVPPGETGELIVTFPEDLTVYTEVACLLPGHYEAGMKAGLNYTSE